jgi:hypothetical protein
MLEQILSEYVVVVRGKHSQRNMNWPNLPTGGHCWRGLHRCVCDCFYKTLLLTSTVHRCSEGDLIKYNKDGFCCEWIWSVSSFHCTDLSLGHLRALQESLVHLLMRILTGENRISVLNHIHSQLYIIQPSLCLPEIAYANLESYFL